MTGDLRLLIVGVAATLFLASLVYLIVVIRRRRPGQVEAVSQPVASAVEVGVDLRSLEAEPPQGIRRILDQPLRTGSWMPEEETPPGESIPAPAPAGPRVEPPAPPAPPAKPPATSAPPPPPRPAPAGSVSDVLRSLDETPPAATVGRPIPVADWTPPAPPAGVEADAEPASPALPEPTAPLIPAMEVLAPVPAAAVPRVIEPAPPVVAPRPSAAVDVLGELSERVAERLAEQAPEAPLREAALKPDAAQADTGTEEYVMVSPVEMWLGEVRVGVKSGTKTFDEFQRLAAHILEQLPRERPGRS